MDALLTPQEAAGILKVSYFSVVRAINSGQLKASKIQSLWRISESDLEAYVDSRKHGKKNVMPKGRRLSHKTVKVGDGKPMPYIGEIYVPRNKFKKQSL